MTNGKLQKLCIGTAMVAAAVGLVGIAAPPLLGQGIAFIIKPETQVEQTQSKFYCNIKALTPEERAEHHILTEKLMKLRKETVEIAKGYELQFDPKTVSLAELAEWVGRESKCCPFFDFHIDLEAEGHLLCLRLTGEDGIKAFIEAEFHLIS